MSSTQKPFTKGLGNAFNSPIVYTPYLPLTIMSDFSDGIITTRKQIKDFLYQNTIEAESVKCHWCNNWLPNTVDDMHIKGPLCECDKLDKGKAKILLENDILDELINFRKWCTQREHIFYKRELFNKFFSNYEKNIALMDLQGI